MTNDTDYMRHVRDAAHNLAMAVEPDAGERAVIRNELMGFAHAVLDAARWEAEERVREANRRAIDHELTQVSR